MRQNYYFFAGIKDHGKLAEVCDEGTLSWINTNELPFDEMNHTARYVMEHYIECGMYTNSLYAGIAETNGVLFRELVEF